MKPRKWVVISGALRGSVDTNTKLPTSTYPELEMLVLKYSIIKLQQKILDKHCS